MKYLTNLLLAVILFVAKVQAVDTLSFQDALKYHRFINEAEMSICSDKYALALKKYGAAARLRSLEKMGSSDLYNYFIAAFDQQELSIARNALRPLIARGWSRDAYGKRMAGFYDSIRLISLLELYDGLGPQQPILDTVYRGLIDSIVEVDQTQNYAIRKRDSGYIRGEGRRYYEQVTLKNMAALKSLFEKRVPSDFIVGRFGENEPVERASFYIVLLHNAQGVTFVDNWSENAGVYYALYKGVCRAEYDPDEFSLFISSPMATNKDSAVRDLGGIQLTLPLSNIDFMAVGDSLFEFKGSLNKKKEFNRRRIMVPGLCSLEDYRRKAIFQFYHKKFRLIPNTTLERWPKLPSGLRQSLLYCSPKT